MRREIKSACGIKKVKGLINKDATKPLELLVPEARIELAPSQGGLDFESSASTNFTTPASIRSLQSSRRAGMLAQRYPEINRIFNI